MLVRELRWSNFVLKFGTHYCDITGESSWVKYMMYQWQSTAKMTGAKIISFFVVWILYRGICQYIKWNKQLKAKEEKTNGQDDDENDENEEELVSITFMNELYSGPSGGTLATMGLLANEKFPTISSSDDPFRKTYDGTMTPPTIDKVPLSICSVITPWDDKTGKQQKEQKSMKTIRIDISHGIN